MNAVICWEYLNTVAEKACPSLAMPITDGTGPNSRTMHAVTPQKLLRGGQRNMAKTLSSSPGLQILLITIYQ